MSLIKNYLLTNAINPEKLNRVIKLTHSWVDDNSAPTVITAVSHKGITVLEDAYGKLTPDLTSPCVDIDSIYPMASISKVITSTIAMSLVEEGLLSIVRPVQEYIPEFIGENKEFVMVHHLMTHTSGIKEADLKKHIRSKSDTFVMPKLDATQHPDVYRMLTLGYDAPLWKMPGEEMSYCGYGFELLAEIIRRITGKSLEENARERIFDPLNMKDSYFVVPETLNDRVVKFPKDSYCGDWSGTMEALKMPRAAGGLYSTARDMINFGQMFLNKGKFNGNRILSKATVETMTRNHIPGVKSYWGKTLFKEAGWGLGWMLSENKKDESGILRSTSTFYHTGAGCSMILVDPVNEIVLVNFTVSMTRLPNGEPLRRFDYITDAVIASIDD